MKTKLARSHQQLLALVAGASITLAMAPFHIWPLALFAPVSLLLLLNPLKPSQAFVTGWFFGFGVFASGASWVYVSIQVHGNTPVPLALVMTFAFVTGLALFFALHAWIWQRFLSGSGWLLSWPALWVLMEAFRSWFLTGFPWLLLGTAHLESPLSGWAPIGGVYAVSGLSLLIGLLVVWALRPQWFPAILPQTSATKPLRAVALTLGGLLLVSGLLLKPLDWTQPQGAPLQLALVQGNIPQEEKWDPNKRQEIIQQYLNLSAEAGEVDVLLWPETALPLTPPLARPFLQEAVEQAGPDAALVTGLASRVPDQNRFYNSLITAGEAEGDYHKVQLVPFGEYLPLEDWIRGVIAFFDLPMSNFIPGPDHPSQLTIKDTQVAPLICYEVAYPDFSARQALGSHWLLTVSNDSWFGRSIGPLQHYQIARFRALETGREMARATNNGITAVIDHQGGIKAELEQFTTGVLTAEIQPRTGTTPFMHLGSWPLFIICLTGLAWKTLPRRSSRKP
ncbi:apolipoprotein N-acyltransferase [Marinospirillum celere]|uniref:Apolipoprotein N-acyltransferase n=1 Tax=Marinospirillum celere TaxID=1122252 RepID=A0A1I1GKG0_9GAMM|nr:apolipoprotein N-acyltransferase [Marinospirillum celere]SFC12034.1 apolipoprotein N-acyltransferase [Marinospirillum celere]